VKTEELSEMFANDLKAREETVKADTGIVLPDGSVAILGESPADRLGRRLENLKQSLGK